MGLKYHLGHTAYVRRVQNVFAGGNPENESKKMFLTKSSIRMNWLADLGYITDNIDSKLKMMKEQVYESELWKKAWTKGF